MAYYSYQSKMTAVPGNGGSINYSLPAPKNTSIVNWGWQNSGDAVQLYASQIFVSNNASQAFMQLVNASAQPIDTWAWWTLYVPGDAAKPDVEATATLVTKT